MQVQLLHCIGNDLVHIVDHGQIDGSDNSLKTISLIDSSFWNAIFNLIFSELLFWSYCSHFCKKGILYVTWSAILWQADMEEAAFGIYRSLIQMWIQHQHFLNFIRASCLTIEILFQKSLYIDLYEGNFFCLRVKNLLQIWERFCEGSKKFWL